MVTEIQKLNFNQPKNISLDKQRVKKRKLGFYIGLTVFFLIITAGLIGGIVFFLLLPLKTNINQTYVKAREVYDFIKKQDLVSAAEKNQEVKESLEKTEKSFKKLSFLKFLPVIKNYYLDGEAGLKAGKAGIEAVEITLKAINPYADILGFKGEGSFVGGTAEERVSLLVKTLPEIIPQLAKIEGKIKEIEDNLQQINAQRYFFKFQGKEIGQEIQKFQNLFYQITNEFISFKPAIEELPDILGYPNPKRYLLIMQNNGELRATGGFMTAYAVMKVESGKVILEKSDDIYSLDEKNKNKIKAPEVIKKYLLSSGLKTGLVPYWYLRDMNLSPDFKVSMETFRKYYEEIPGESKVDGIIAIDTKILRDILAFLGPIEVPGYGRFTLEEDKRCHNIPQVICELEIMAGTPLPHMKRDRKDILGPLTRAILDKIFQLSSEKWGGLIKLGYQEINEKHLLFYFPEEKKQLAVEKINAGGRIANFEGDYLHINDTNFGGAKSNFFVKHQVEQKTEITPERKIIKTLTLSYSNSERMDNCNLERVSGVCLNGILRNYLRVYVPKGSRLLEGIGSEEEFKTYEELDKTVFEGFFTLRGEGGKAKVVLTYELPFEYNPQAGLKMLIQKQAGTEGHPYTLFFGEEKKEFLLTTDQKIEWETYGKNL